MNTNVATTTKKTRTTAVKALVLWYDETINLESIIASTIEICNLSRKESVDLVLDSLLDGSVKLRTGNKETLVPLQVAFRKIAIKTTIE
jgi:hypothetical protein